MVWIKHLYQWHHSMYFKQEVCLYRKNGENYLKLKIWKLFHYWFCCITCWQNLHKICKEKLFPTKVHKYQEKHLHSLWKTYCITLIKEPTIRKQMESEKTIKTDREEAKSWREWDEKKMKGDLIHPLLLIKLNSSNLEVLRGRGF